MREAFDVEEAGLEFRQYLENTFGVMFDAKVLGNFAGFVVEGTGVADGARGEHESIVTREHSRPKRTTIVIASYPYLMMMSRLMQTIALVLLGLAILLVAGGVLLGEIAAHPMRLRTSHAKLPELLRSGNPLARVEDVELTASDGVLLRGTFAVPEKQNGSAVILLHGISDNRMVSQDLPDCSWRTDTEYCL